MSRLPTCLTDRRSGNEHLQGHLYELVGARIDVLLAPLFLVARNPIETDSATHRRRLGFLSAGSFHTFLDMGAEHGPEGGVMQRNEPRNNIPDRVRSLVKIEMRHGPRKSAAKLRSGDVRVAPKVARRLRSQIARLRDLPDYDLDPTYYEDACADVLDEAAPELIEALRQLREAGEPALISIFGLQVDDTPVATPLDGIFNQREAPVELAIQAGIARHLGIRAVAFAAENGGRVVRPVCPVRKYADVSSSQGAKVDLIDHSDNGHLASPTRTTRIPIACPR